MKISKRMRHAKHGKHTKRAKYTRHTKHRGKQYKNKRTYRKHPRKLKHKSRLQKGGVEQCNFEAPINSTSYSADCELTYKRKGAFTNKTKSFEMVLTYDSDKTMENKNSVLPYYPNRDDISNIRQLLKPSSIGSNDIISAESNLLCIFMLELTSKDEKRQQFQVYFRVDTIVVAFKNRKVNEVDIIDRDPSVDTRENRTGLVSQVIRKYPDIIKRVIRVSSNGVFDSSSQIIVRSQFALVPLTTADPVTYPVNVYFIEPCSQFIGLNLTEKINDSPSGEYCFFPCSDNKNFFIQLVNKMSNNEEVFKTVSKILKTSKHEAQKKHLENEIMEYKEGIYKETELMNLTKKKLELLEKTPPDTSLLLQTKGFETKKFNELEVGSEEYNRIIEDKKMAYRNMISKCESTIAQHINNIEIFTKNLEQLNSPPPTES
jgi:hypothetical protein